MKNLVLIFCLSISSLTFSQLTTEVFDINDNKLATTTTKNSMYWKVDEEEGLLGCLIQNQYGEDIGGYIVEIINTKVDSKTTTFAIQTDEGTIFLIVFWTNLSKNEIPLVAYDYKDGYILMSGNVNY